MKRMKTVIATGLVAVILTILAGIGSASAQDGTAASTPVSGGSGIDGAVAWLQSQQAEDGGFVGFSGESDPGATIDAVIALVSAEHAGVDTGNSIEQALAYLGSDDVALVYAQTGVGQAAKLVLGLTAVGEDPADFAGVDAMPLVENGVNAETGLYGVGIYDHALAILAFAATGIEVPASAIDALAATQAENGGWAFDASTDPSMADSNTTSLAVQALVAADQGESELVATGLAYLESTWLEGGAAYSGLPDTVADANSTALVIQALVATGSDVTEHVAVLATFQNPSGAYFYNATDTSDNLFATLQAIPALASVALPVSPAMSDATPAATNDLVAA